MRAQGELWYDNNSQTYAGLCADATTAGVQGGEKAAASAAGIAAANINKTLSESQVKPLATRRREVGL